MAVTADHDPPLPAWVVWTNRAVVTLAGTIGAVMVADHAAASGEALDVALVAIIIAATMAAVVWPDRMVAVLTAAVASMLGLALVPPLWLLAPVTHHALPSRWPRRPHRPLRHRRGPRAVTVDTAAFIEFLVRSDVLTFGDFTTKSGRATPYFLNVGRIRTGRQIGALGRFYADRVVEVFGRDVDVLFGPAYKGIPLAVATATALAEHHDLDVAFCFDRKEAKDHGEGGVLVGHTPRDGDRVVIVEDVTTAGTSIRETVPLLRAAADVDLRGLVVAVDRAERGRGTTSALQEVAADHAMTATAITDIDTVVAHLREHEVDGRRVLDDDDVARILAYRDQWGA